VEKADLNQGYQNPKRKLGVTTHFSEIIEHKRKKKMPFKAFFRIMVAYLFMKNAWLPTFFFLDSNNLC